MAPSIWKLPKPSGLLSASSSSSIGGRREGAGASVDGEGSWSSGEAEPKASRSDGPASALGCLMSDASSQGLLSSDKLSAHSGFAIQGR